MSIAQAMIAELEHEARTTRAFFERIPADKLTHRPHPKSHTVGELALHIANLPGFLVKFAQQDASPLPDNKKLFNQPTTVQEIIAAHEKSMETAKQVLAGLDDAKLMTNWSGLLEGKPVITVPKATVLRIFMMNHWIHHRGQLGVHLRLLGANIPSSYGPSGDEG